MNIQDIKFVWIETGKTIHANPTPEVPYPGQNPPNEPPPPNGNEASFEPLVPPPPNGGQEGDGLPKEVEKEATFEPPKGNQHTTGV